MRKQGFEWPGPDAPTCGAPAEERSTGRLISCKLVRGHDSLEHHWQERWGDRIESASWIGPVDGPPTMIGPRPTDEGRTPANV